jgi:hypothetical protein
MNCALCLEEKSLCDSHIVPEFFYKSLYDDEPKRYFGISTEADERIDIRQKGIWEKLLCKDCEQRFSKWESYAKRVFYPEPAFQRRQDRLVILDVDYAKFKLFQLSVLWRASVSGRKEFQYVDIGQYEKVIRKMLLEENPGAPDEFGCFMVTSPKYKHLLDQMLISPDMPVREETSVAQFLMAGIFWNYFVSRNNPEMKDHAAFLTRQGMLSVFEESDIVNQYVQDLALRWKQSGNLDEVLDKFVD